MASAEKVVVAVDVGSTAARAGLFTLDGRRLGRADRGFAVNRPAPEHAEHSSDEIWQSVIVAVRGAVAAAGVAPEAVAGLAFDATCSLVLLDAAGRPVTVSPTGEDRWNVIMWADHRAIAEVEEINATGHHVLDYVGGTMSPEMELPKLLWLKRHMPQSWQRAGIALDLADFLAWRATGKLAVSVCTVTCKWAYLNHEEKGWPLDLLAKFGLDDLPERASLPEKALPIGARAGTLTPAVAAELGLTAACTVGVGLIDAHAGGLGVLSPGGDTDRQLAMIAGTSTCHMAVAHTARLVPGIWGPYFGAMVPGLWLNEAGQSATGALLDHILDWHAEGRPLGKDGHRRVGARIAELLAAEGPAFVGDLQVIPDFRGNRSPLADPHATGVIHGLTIDASFDALCRLYYATAVGIALGTRHILDALDEAGYDITELRLTGGHAASEVLVRLYADSTGCTVVLPEESDGVLLGSAIVASVGAGLHPDIGTASAAMVRAGRRVEPDPSVREFFDRRYRSFLAMHDHSHAVRAKH